MSMGRTGVIVLALVVVGGVWAAVALTGDDRGVSRTDALLLEKARQEDPAALQDVVEDDDAAPGPDPTGDGTRGNDGTSGGDNGGVNSADGALTDGGEATTGSSLEDRLRAQLAGERASTNALRTKLRGANATSRSLRRQLARERRSDTSAGGAQARGSAPAPAPAPPRSNRGGGDSSYSGGGDT